MKTYALMLVMAVVCGLVVLVPSTLAQGTLTPPDEAFTTNMTPKASMKTLNQIEPRTPITSLPFEITNAGSYYVTANLTCTNNDNGITIDSDDVQLDLNGFALNGTPGTLHGVLVSGPLHHNISIRNGVVRGWEKCGINAFSAQDSLLANVKAYTNGYNGEFAGMEIGDNSLVTGCGAYWNAGDGIRAMSGSTIRDCKSRYNGIKGIKVDRASKVIDCTAANNSIGIFAENYCTIRDCTVVQNKYDGIVVIGKCRVVKNNCGENGFAGGYGAGIRVQGHHNRIEDNNLSDNNRGIRVFGEGDYTNVYGNLIIRNSASGNQDDAYQWSTNATGGDCYGEVLDMSATGGEGFTNSNPWSNFRF